MTAIRPPAVAGTFYPGDADELRSHLSLLLATAQATASGGTNALPKALIAPHAGYVYSGPVAATAYWRLFLGRDRIKRVVLVGPSHHLPFRGMAVAKVEAWRTPLGLVPIDRAGCDRLARLPMAEAFEEAHAYEHSLEVHVPFLQTILGEFDLVPIVAGFASPEEVAEALEVVWGGPETLIVVSTDLSHFLDYDAARRVDGETVAAIERLDCRWIGPDQACGRVPLSGLLAAAAQKGMTIETLDVRNSGDIAGGMDRVVGYGSWALYEQETQPAQSAEEAEIRAVGDQLVALARSSIEHGLTHGEPRPASSVVNPPELVRRNGAAFVTLKDGGSLRGCIGSASPWRTLLDDILDNAFAAAFEDIRFSPIQAGEMAGISLSVSVLTPPVAMVFKDEADLLSQLRPGIDGLVIDDEGRRALFLPGVWAALPDPTWFLGQLKIKAGLLANHWSPSLRASRFQTVDIQE